MKILQYTLKTSSLSKRLRTKEMNEKRQKGKKKYVRKNGERGKEDMEASKGKKLKRDIEKFFFSTMLGDSSRRCRHAFSI